MDAFAGTGHERSETGVAAPRHDWDALDRRAGITRSDQSSQRGVAEQERHLCARRSACGAEQPWAVPVLVALAAHEDEDVRYQAARSLPDVADGRRDDAVVDALIRLIADSDLDVRN